jgi:hypothetical protein
MVKFVGAVDLPSCVNTIETPPLAVVFELGSMYNGTGTVTLPLVTEIAEEVTEKPALFEKLTVTGSMLPPLVLITRGAKGFEEVVARDVTARAFGGGGFVVELLVVELPPPQELVQIA